MSLYTKEEYTEYLHKKKDALQQHLVCLYTLREFFPSVDKKIYNVRIRRAIDELPGLWCYQEEWSLFSVKARDLGYGENLVITFDKGILDGKRIDNKKAQEVITKRLQQRRKELAEIEQDMLDGYERYQELMRIKAYYRQLFEQFSNVSKDKLRDEVKMSYVG